MPSGFWFFGFVTGFFTLGFFSRIVLAIGYLLYYGWLLHLSAPEFAFLDTASGKLRVEHHGNFAGHAFKPALGMDAGHHGEIDKTGFGVVPAVQLCHGLLSQIEMVHPSKFLDIREIFGKPFGNSQYGMV